MDIHIISQILIALFIVFYALFLFKNRNNRTTILSCFVTIWLIGTGLYMYAFSHEPVHEGSTTILLRSAVSAIKMFIYDNDLLEIEHIQHETLFLDFFIPTFLAAILTSSMTIINTFGEKMMSWFVLTLRSRKRKFKHIFIGVDEKSLMIANELGNEEIAFITVKSEEHGGGAEHEMIMNTLKSLEKSNPHANLFKKDNVTVLTAKERIQSAGSGEGVFERMGIGKIARFIDESTSIYLLSDDADKNFHDILILESDPALRDLTIHASVRRRGLTPAYKNTLKGTGAHFIYASSLSVVDMMKTHECHPAQVMDIDRDESGKGLGTASGIFSALVAGFGETGQAALKFIYEFSSAIRQDGTALPVRIYVQDSSIEDRKGLFTALNPEMDKDGIISYDNKSAGSSAFWDFLKEHIDELNYVVMSTGNDEKNLDVAVQVLTYASKVRKEGLKNFKILIRKTYTRHHEQDLLNKYNKGCGAEVMRFFGEYSSVFAANMIVSGNHTGINNDATELADRLRANYDKLTGHDSAGLMVKSGDKQTDARNRLEIHQFISRANHIASLRCFIDGNDSPSEDVIENLARCEQLRYTRYLKAHEYSSCAQDDYIRRHSSKLKHWDDLSDDDKSYHRTMVKASLIS